MNHIIAGDPAPTNLTAEALLEVMAFRLATGTALVEPNQFTAAVAEYRLQVLAEATAAVSARLLPNVLFGADIARNQGVSDAIAAINALTGGESHG